MSRTNGRKSNQLGIEEEWGKLTFPYSFLIEKKERRINQKVSSMILSKGLLDDDDDEKFHSVQVQSRVVLLQRYTQLTQHSMDIGRKGYEIHPDCMKYMRVEYYIHT